LNLDFGNQERTNSTKGMIEIERAWFWWKTKSSPLWRDFLVGEFVYSKIEPNQMIDGFVGK